MNNEMKDKQRPSVPQTMLIEAAALITTLRREADHLDAYAGIPCQSENAWHARDYRRWANLIDDLLASLPPRQEEEKDE